jgi:DNA-binding transcriptional MerR regulator
MRIGELAKRSGVSVRALRYYEEQGLLASVRSPSGQRHYVESAVEKVLFFQDMYAAGLNSRTIARLLPCMDTGLTDVEQRDLLRAEHARISEQVERLTAARDRLTEVIAVSEQRAEAAISATA